MKKKKSNHIFLVVVYRIMWAQTIDSERDKINSMSIRCFIALVVSRRYKRRCFIALVVSRRYKRILKYV